MSDGDSFSGLVDDCYAQVNQRPVRVRGIIEAVTEFFTRQEVLTVMWYTMWGIAPTVVISFVQDLFGVKPPRAKDVFDKLGKLDKEIGTIRKQLESAEPVSRAELTRHIEKELKRDGWEDDKIDPRMVNAVMDQFIAKFRVKVKD
jgi:hypothetical protein